MKSNERRWWTNRLVPLLGVVVLSFMLGYWLRATNSKDSQLAPLALQAVEQVNTEERMLYVCPMMCVRPMDKPGQCPICGMTLTAVPGGDETGSPRLKLSPEAVSLAQIQVAPVERKFVYAEVRLFGQINYDPAHIAKITAFMPGVIDRVYVKRAGQFVRWGDPLFDIYSSDLLATQQQLLGALKYVPSFLAFQAGKPYVAREAVVAPRKAAEDPDKRSPEVEAALDTIAAIRHKLSILGLPKRDIDEFMKVGEPTGIATVYASMYGQVIEQNAYEGTYVNTGTTVFTIADPQYVWAKLDAYEADYPWIRKGQEVSFVTDAYPGETFKGTVVYIDPVFNINTRTFTIGAVYPDPGSRLKAGMLIRATIHTRLTEDGKVAGENKKTDKAPLVIPASAPLITGKRAVVYVAMPEEEWLFEGREITLGPKAKDYYVVLAGLSEGERVVVNGNFKIDSAVQIRAKPSMMSSEGGHSAIAHLRHGGSESMHEDYSSERMKSRMKSSIDSVCQHDERPSNVKPGNRIRTDSQTNRHSTITRRRPGTYGDTTRQ